MVDGDAQDHLVGRQRHRGAAGRVHGAVVRESECRHDVGLEAAAFAQLHGALFEKRAQRLHQTLMARNVGAEIGWKWG